MRTIRFFALIGILLFLLRPLPTLSVTPHQLSDAPANYVVIGAFRIHKNAIRFTNHAQNDLHLTAKYEINPARNLYYVYVLSTPDRERAITEARKLRLEPELKDTWVYSGFLGKLRSGQQPQAGIDINPITNAAIENIPTVQEQSASIEPSTIDPANSTTSTPTEETKPVESPGQIEENAIGKSFFFKLIRETDGEPVEGDVDVIDLDKLKKVGSYKGNLNVRISNPSGKSGKLSLVCEVFGYRKVQRDIDYNNPSSEDITVEDGSVVVPFELMRLQKGDIATMYNVYFFKDAGVMRPESRYEVTSLLEMLKENPKYKIKIHGHTNGKASGKIISLEEGSTNFFSLSKTKEGFGSAKKLSEERANVIKTFLVSNGIDEKRMEIKAWGGKRPIHDKHSTKAQENVRVEIEILED